MYRVLALVVFVFTASSATLAGEIDMPVFKKGMWHFKRVITHGVGVSRYLPNAITGIQKEHEMCVDPTDNMREIFKSETIGTCSPEKPQMEGNRYVFMHRCDFNGPSRTEIVITSSDSYMEINEPLFSKQKDTVTATRIGDCH